MYINWENTVVTTISGIKIDMPTEACVSIFTDNDLTTIGDNHFEINLTARLLNQVYVVPAPPPGYNFYQEQPEGAVGQMTSGTNSGVTASAPLFSFTTQ